MAIIATLIVHFVLRRRGLWVSPRALVRDGQPIFGQITNKWTQRRRGPKYWLQYSYELNPNRPLKSTMPVTAAIYDQAQKDARVLILYDPDHPRQSVIYSYCGYQAC
jgi:hypothetical protein